MMTLKIGDFVLQDYNVSEVHEIDMGGNGGGVSLGSGRDRLYDRNYFMYTDWWIDKDARKIIINDLADIAEAIKDNHPELKKPEVKEFLNRLSKWCLVNLT